MMNFITDNIGTIAVLAILSAAVMLACVKLYKDRKSGKSSCGGNCADCPYSPCRGKKR